MISILNLVFILPSSGAWFKFKDKYKKFESITGESYAWALATDQRIWVVQAFNSQRVCDVLCIHYLSINSPNFMPFLKFLSLIVL